MDKCPSVNEKIIQKHSNIGTQPRHIQGAGQVISDFATTSDHGADDKDD